MYLELGAQRLEHELLGDLRDPRVERPARAPRAPAGAEAVQHPREQRHQQAGQHPAGQRRQDQGRQQPARQGRRTHHGGLYHLLTPPERSILDGNGHPVYSRAIDDAG